jgi:uncharacterized membrane protein (UPF0127 family)
MFLCLHRTLHPSWGKAMASLAVAASLVALGLSSKPLHAQTQKPAQQSQQAQHLPTVELQAGIHRIQAMLATTPAEREKGLMHRKEMLPNEGMLFVFEQAGQQCFWMKNTLLPLDAAFLEDDGTVVNVASMQPMTENPHCSERPVRFVLEMNQGWFMAKGFFPGKRLTGKPFSATQKAQPKKTAG